MVSLPVAVLPELMLSQWNSVYCGVPAFELYSQCIGHMGTPV